MRRLALALVVVVLAACGGPSPTPTPTQNRTTSPSIVGTVTVTVGTRTGTYTDATCFPISGLKSGQVGVGAGHDTVDGVGLAFRADGTAFALSGAIGGALWAVTQNPQGTINGDRSGTFSGKDVMSGADVSGTFTCKCLQVSAGTCR